MKIKYKVFYPPRPPGNILALTPHPNISEWRPKRKGDHLGPQIPKISLPPQKKFVRKLFTLLGHFSNKSQNKYLNHVPVYSQIQRIQIRYPKYQFIVQNTANMPKYFRNIDLSKQKNNNKIGKLQKTYKCSSFYFVISAISIIHIL